MFYYKLLVYRAWLDDWYELFATVRASSLEDLKLEFIKICLKLHVDASEYKLKRYKTERLNDGTSVRNYRVDLNF